MRLEVSSLVSVVVYLCSVVQSQNNKNMLLMDFIAYSKKTNLMYSSLSEGRGACQYSFLVAQRVFFVSSAGDYRAVFPSLCYENIKSMLHWGCFHMKQQGSLFMAISQFSFSFCLPYTNEHAHTIIQSETEISEPVCVPPSCISIWAITPSGARIWVPEKIM